MSLQYNDWLSVRGSSADIEPDEIFIYDQIGTGWHDQSGVGAKQFDEALKAIPRGKQINVRINSPGGNVWDGFAIYNMLLARRDCVTVTVDGLAASIASVIAMAGKEVRMPINSLMMIHRASGVAIGNASDMTAMSAVLSKHDGMIAEVYNRKTGKGQHRYAELMAVETWLTGEECHAEGLCDFLLAERQIENRFDMSRFKNFPGIAASAAGVDFRNAAEDFRAAVERYAGKASDDEMPDYDPENPEAFDTWCRRKGLI